jgi:hypothetical protein
MTIRYWIASAIQYTTRHDVYSVTIPDRRRAISIPPRFPETTRESACARVAGGAMSPTKGRISWGVTVVTEVMKERAAKAGKEVVRQSPSHWVGFQ